MLRLTLSLKLPVVSLKPPFGRQPGFLLAAPAASPDRAPLAHTHIYVQHCRLQGVICAPAAPREKAQVRPRCAGGRARRTGRP